MNNWKDVPHLFANGKFKFVRKNGQIETIIGCRDHRYYIYDDMTHEPNGMGTLIARKIDDITDKELSDLSWRLNADYTKKEKATTVHDFIQLLSIGVYPFDQSHFEDGTVIDIKEVDNE